MPDATSAAPRRGRPPTGAREALVDAARELFVERDFDHVTTEDIRTRAGVSRGALYHHFDGKLALFRAAYDASEVAALERVAAAADPTGGPFDRLASGCRAYLRECATSRELQRIGLLQSRQVFGWEGWRAAAATYGIGLMIASIAAAAEAGEITTADVATTAHLVLGSLIEAGLLVATAPEPEAALPGVETEFLRLLHGLRTTPG
jgi:AcrR family transcriptional regulator